MTSDGSGRRMAVWLLVTACLAGGARAAEVTSLTFDDDVSPPIGLFHQVVFTALAGTQPAGAAVEYRFSVDKDGAGWEVQRDYAQDTDYRWTPNLPGNYQARVEARVVGSTAESEREAFITDLEVKPIALQIVCDPPVPDAVAGSPVTFTLSAETDPPGGEVEYRMTIRERDEKNSLIYLEPTAWASVETLGFVPGAVTDYIVTIYARIVGTSGRWTDYRTFEYVAASANAPITLGFTRQVGECLGDATTYAITATTTPPGVPVEYGYHIYKQYVLLHVQDYTASNVLVYSPSEAGIYMTVGLARVVGSTAKWEAKRISNFVVTDCGIALDVDVQPPSPAETLYSPVTMTATASGYAAGTELEYRFSASYWSGIYVEILSSDWGSANQWSFTPQCDAPYTVQAFVRAAGSTATDKIWKQTYWVDNYPYLDIELTANRPSPIGLSVPVTFTADATVHDTGDRLPTEYRWSVNNEFRTVWRPDNTFIWFPLAAGYRDHIVVHARTIGSTAYSDGNALLIYTVNPLTATLTGDPPSPISVGSPVTLTAGAGGFAAGAELAYRFEVRQGATWTRLRDYDPDNTAVWTPTMPDLYWLAAYVREAGSEEEWEVYTWDLSYTVLANAAPVAACRDLTIALAEPGTVTIAPADVDGGSSDPDTGDTLTLSLNIDTFDCSALGPNPVILTVADPAGATDTCTAAVTVTAASCADLRNQVLDRLCEGAAAQPFSRQALTAAVNSLVDDVFAVAWSCDVLGSQCRADIFAAVVWVP